MYKRGKRVGKIQLYRCLQGHQFRKDNLPSWDDSFIEYVVFVYLKCLSLNTTIDIVRETFEMDILSKGNHTGVHSLCWECLTFNGRD